MSPESRDGVDDDGEYEQCKSFSALVEAGTASGRQSV